MVESEEEIVRPKKLTKRLVFVGSDEDEIDDEIRASEAAAKAVVNTLGPQVPRGRQAEAKAEEAEFWNQEFWVTKTKFGGPMIVYKGFPFIQDNKKATERAGTGMNWKCNTTTCIARGHTNELCAPFIPNDKPHNHQATIEKIISDHVRKLMLHRALTTTEAPRTISREEQKKMPIECSQFLPTNNALAKAMRYLRQKEFGPVPKSIAEIDLDMEELKNHDGLSFFLGDSGADDPERVIVFGTVDNIKWLKQNPQWFIDGTFDICPKLFLQLFTIQITKNAYTLPLVYALLPNKKSTTYKKLFDIVESKINAQTWRDADDLVWRADFELGIWKGKIVCI